jgi:hypothetical protein
VLDEVAFVQSWHRAIRVRGALHAGAIRSADHVESAPSAVGVRLALAAHVRRHVAGRSVVAVEQGRAQPEEHVLRSNGGTRSSEIVTAPLCLTSLLIEAELGLQLIAGPWRDRQGVADRGPDVAAAAQAGCFVERAAPGRASAQLTAVARARGHRFQLVARKLIRGGHAVAFDELSAAVVDARGGHTHRTGLGCVAEIDADPSTRRVAAAAVCTASIRRTRARARCDDTQPPRRGENREALSHHIVCAP